MAIVSTMAWYIYGLSNNVNKPYFEVIPSNTKFYGIIKCTKDGKYLTFDLSTSSRIIADHLGIPYRENTHIDECQICREWLFYSEHPDPNGTLLPRLGRTNFGRGLRAFDTLQEARNFINRVIQEGEREALAPITFLRPIGYYDDLNPPFFNDCEFKEYTPLSNEEGSENNSHLPTKGCGEVTINVEDTDDYFKVIIDHPEDIDNFEVILTNSSDDELRYIIESGQKREVIYSKWRQDSGQPRLLKVIYDRECPSPEKEELSFGRYPFKVTLSQYRS